MPSPRTRKPLSPERVVDAALRLVDREGIDALSMRRLGGVLRVEAMSLYKHVPSKGALVDLLVARVLGDVRPAPPDAHWDARLRHVAGELRRVALAHPQLFPLLATRVPRTPDAFAPLEAVLAALEDAGLGSDATVQHFWAFIAYTTGALLAETAAQTGAGDASLAVPATLDRAQFPHLGRLAKKIGACDFATEYARGLDILIAAIRAAAGAALTSRRRRPTVVRRAR